MRRAGLGQVPTTSSDTLSIPQNTHTVPSASMPVQREKTSNPNYNTTQDEYISDIGLPDPNHLSNNIVHNIHQETQEQIEQEQAPITAGPLEGNGQMHPPNA